MVEPALNLYDLPFLVFFLYHSFFPLFNLKYIYIVFVLATLALLFSYSSFFFFFFTPFSSYIVKNGLTLPFLILSRSGSLKCPLFVGLQPPPSHRLLRSQWDSSHPNPFSNPFHTHMHFGRFFHTLKQADIQKHAHWYAQAFDSTIAHTHSHSHIFGR